MTASSVVVFPKEKALKFPCLMVDKALVASHPSSSNGLVVLFTAKAEGTVVFTGRSPWELGVNTKAWSMSTFEHLKGNVVIKGE